MESMEGFEAVVNSVGRLGLIKLCTVEGVFQVRRYKAGNVGDHHGGQAIDALLVEVKHVSCCVYEGL